MYLLQRAEKQTVQTYVKGQCRSSLEITLPPGNAGYDILKRMTSEIIVYRDKQELWRGRILSEKMNFWNNRTLTCEGELSYLNDTIQPQAKYPEGTTVGSFLTSVLDNHNKRYGDDEERYSFTLMKHISITTTSICRRNCYRLRKDIRCYKRKCCQCF